MQRTVQTDSLGPVGFRREVIKKENSLVKEVEALQKMASDEKAARKGVGEELMTLKSLVSISDSLATKLTESDKALEAALAEVALLKEQV